MAINVPMPSLPGEALLRGLDTGSNMFAKIMNARYNASLHPSGDVANAMYVEQLRNQYGENDPRYLQAKRAHEMQLSARQSLMDYRTQLSNLAPYRAATPEEKLIAAQKGQGVLQTFGNKGGENQRVEAGMVSGEDGHRISEEEAKVYNQALGKKTTDAAIRNKIPYAKNVKITLDSINPDALVQYSGPEGSMRYGMDTLKAALGNPTPQFMEYQKALSSAKTLSKQLRQFWGDSIQPSATEKIDQLTNPSHWLKNPDVAKQQFEQLKQITDQELETFYNAGTSPFKLDFDKNTGSFFTTTSQKSAKKEEAAEKGEEQNINNESDDFLNQMVPQLLQLNPNYTASNIRHTAKNQGISIEEVIRRLLDKAKGGQ